MDMVMHRPPRGQRCRKKVWRGQCNQSNSTIQDTRRALTRKDIRRVMKSNHKKGIKRGTRKVTKRPLRPTPNPSHLNLRSSHNPNHRPHNQLSRPRHPYLKRHHPSSRLKHLYLNNPRLNPNLNIHRHRSRPLRSRPRKRNQNLQRKERGRRMTWTP
jgi:hypothetical protein